MKSKDHTAQSQSTLHRAQNPDSESETVPRTRAQSIEPKAQITEHRARTQSTDQRALKTEQELRVRSQRAGAGYTAQSTELGLREQS